MIMGVKCEHVKVEVEAVNDNNYSFLYVCR